jgi:hypothetical protein
MRVLGKTRAEEAYRLGLRIGDGHRRADPRGAPCPPRMGTARVPHQAAYEWIETRAHPLARAIRDFIPARAPARPSTRSRSNPHLTRDTRESPDHAHRNPDARAQPHHGGRHARQMAGQGGRHRFAGDILAEIETDKATMEFEAVDEGVIGKILVEEGTEGVKVNAPIAVLLEEGESADDIGGTAAPAEARRRSPRRRARAAAAATPARPRARRARRGMAPRLRLAARAPDRQGQGPRPGPGSRAPAPMAAS